VVDSNGGNRVAFTPPAAMVPNPSPGVWPPWIVSRSSSAPDFSPDGSKIVFSQCCDANQNSRIVVAPVTDGSAPVALTSPDAGHSDGSPAFSPDGTRVVFVRTDVGTGQSVISSVPAEGGAATTLSTPGSFDSDPTWAPANAQDVPPTTATDPPAGDPPPSVMPTPPATTPNRTPVATVAQLPHVGSRKVSAKRGAARLSVVCPANAHGRCTGMLTLQARLKRHQAPRTIGRARFQIAPGATAAVEVRLSGAARALLRGHRSLAAVARLALSSGPGSATSLKLTG
jgi:WD40-like Beta Propeller Repeat